MKYLVDISRAVANGILTPAQGEELRRAAASETAALAINVLLSLGVLAIAGGVLALLHATAPVAALSLVLVGGGAALRFKYPGDWSFLGLASILVGALTLSAGILILWDDAALAFLAASAILLAIGIAARSNLLAALAVVAIAGLLGSSSGYEHAGYILWVREPSATILAFAALAALGLYLSQRVPPDYRGLATVFARLSAIWANFGFWVGSLWGDYPLHTWLAPSEGWYQLRGRWVFIPDLFFVILWALALLAFGLWGARRNRRFVVNTAAVFAGIHFYTQWFERLSATPASIIAGGLIAVAVATLLWRYNRPPAAAAA